MLELRNVTKRFANIPAVDNVSFTARAGEVSGYVECHWPSLGLRRWLLEEY